nr:hypothetical protein [Cytobacillus sp. NCCP-133]
MAWGVTNTCLDVQDLYIEKRNPDIKKSFCLMKNGKSRSNGRTNKS